MKYNWNIFLQQESKKDYFKELKEILTLEYDKFVCYPDKSKILSFFQYCPFSNLKVVIIGQDPYYKENQADGLCFSVPIGIPFPPSLRNIFLEVKNCFNRKFFPYSGSLIRWAIQGVLLLNSILTVRKDSPGSHKNIGWRIFTDSIIHVISNKKKNIVFLLWGKYAKEKSYLINSDNNHYVLKTSHPSPFSANIGFFGSKHFLKTNFFLQKIGLCYICW
ncbi:uracil-DNA glycosylase [Blattabacterium cuenoti]|uniref:uracil-DNA glycosylase n=1 Tax=Blattabacterium cuenoti TaxID=1653831 RepID=UPI00163C900B|nr:uracil-DNA glycosylase [Blattabacterium cuenoti]